MRGGGIAGRGKKMWKVAGKISQKVRMDIGSVYWRKNKGEKT